MSDKDQKRASVVEARPFHALPMPRYGYQQRSDAERNGIKFGSSLDTDSDKKPEAPHGLASVPLNLS